MFPVVFRGRDHSTDSSPKIRRTWSSPVLSVCALAASVLVLLLSSCAKGGGPGSSGSGSSTPAVAVTGNWEFQATATKGTAPFSSLAGYLHESGSGTSEFVTAAVQAQSDSCYANLANISLTGSVNGAQMIVTSIPVDSQVLSLNLQANSGVTQLAGNYSVTGGCAAGVSGSLTGQKYALVDGTYSGALANDVSRTMSLTLTQYQDGTGDGGYQTSGTATFANDSCFSQGTLSAQNGTVIGNAVSLTFTTNDAAGAQVVMTGTINTSADTLTLTSIEVNNGSCPGALGPATLHLQ